MLHRKFNTVTKIPKTLSNLRIIFSTIQVHIFQIWLEAKLKQWNISRPMRSCL